jgi:predicted alpha/beta-hydrolase family hydrolase
MLPAVVLALAVRASLPVFGPGPLTNLNCYPRWSDRGCDAAWTNAAAHVGWSLAIPLLGKEVGGRRGLWIAGGAWIAASLLQEAFLHAPEHPGPGYPSEVRTDLLTRLVPCALVLVIDLATHR